MLTNRENPPTNVRNPRHLQPALDTSVVQITPENAAALLRDNANIRRVCKQVVDQYANEMAENRWQLNGESIKLDRDGKLIDGQHRLHACVQAGVSFTTLLVRGAVAGGVDEGKPRTIAHLLTGAGLPGGAIAGAMIRALYLLSTEKDPWLFTEKIGNQVYLSFLDTKIDMDRFRWALELGYANQGVTPGSVIGLIAYQVGLTPTARELAEEFFVSVQKKIGLMEGSPAHQLMRWSESAKTNRKTGSVWRRATYIVAARAWNAHVKGQKPGHLWSKLHESNLPKLVAQ